jgi:hypothetical protein
VSFSKMMPLSYLHIERQRRESLALLANESLVVVDSRWTCPAFEESFAFLLVSTTGLGSLESRCLWSGERGLSFSLDNVALVGHIKRQG